MTKPVGPTKNRGLTREEALRELQAQFRTFAERAKENFDSGQGVSATGVSWGRFLAYDNAATWLKEVLDS